MVDTYSSKPFISYDGPDAKGVRAEVKVLMGLGHIDNIKSSDKGGKAANVIFSVENNKYTMSGWAPVDSDIMKIVETARENNEPIHFRIETKRKDHIDRSKPMSDLLPPKDMEAARENTYKSLAAVKRIDDTEWTISEHALTRFDEDPVGGSNSANNYTLEELRAMSPKPTAPSVNAGPRYFPKFGEDSWNEPPAYITWIDRGENFASPGSNAVSAPINIFLFVAQYAKDHNLEVSENEKQNMAKAILSVCNMIQTKAYKGRLEHADMSYASHTRARGLVFEMCRSYYPLTEETFRDEKVRKEWAKNTATTALKIWLWGIGIVEGEH